MVVYDKDYIGIARKLTAVLKEYGCTVEEAKKALHMTEQLIISTTPVAELGNGPYTLSKILDY